MQRVFVVSASRSAIGSFGGSLAELPPAELGAEVARQALDRAGQGARDLIREVFLGNVLAAGHGMNVARQVSLKSGLHVNVPAAAVNMVCGSGLKAVALGAAEIALGRADAVLAGGVESMSQAGYVSLTNRFGARLGHAELKDLMIQDGLTDAFIGCHMGMTAENLAERYGITRAEQDAYALESQKRAQAAIAAGHFKQEIVPVTLMKRGKKAGMFETDEHPRSDATAESLAALKTAFKQGGTVTAGNASGINDGAAMVVLMSEDGVRRSGAKPLAEIIDWASAGVEPAVMGIGPVEAVRNLEQRAKLSPASFDLIEANEAFAVQALAVSRELNFDPAKVNPSGGAVALGHPIGASGARILVTLIHGLRRTGKELGLATLCVGGGQGIAMAVRAHRA